MKVSIDANVLISYLLNPDTGRPPGKIVQAALDHQFDVMLSETLLDEITSSVQGKPYLRLRVGDDGVDLLFRQLRATAHIAPEIQAKIPEIVRDPGDNYLIAHAVLAEVDYLVTGDRDLLELDDSFEFRIVTPAQFLVVLRSAQDR